MMWALPLAVFIFMMSLIYMQERYYEFKKILSDQNEQIKTFHELEEFQKDFEDYKKRVDTLTLKAGFKL